MPTQEASQTSGVDCDNDGMLDYYDCDPSVPQSQKMKICHNGNTICINNSALAAHLSHGDYQGPCAASRGVYNIQEKPKPDIEESAKPGFNIFPNPANNQINIRNNNNKALGTVSIYDVSGKMIYNNFIGSSRATTDIKKFSPGVYYLRSDQMEKVLKFVKQ